jgi:hypothetical protein
MYPNIDNELGIIALTWFLNTYTNISTKKKELYINLAKIILKYSYITYKNDIYKQMEGTAMGTNFAICYATIYLFYINQPYYKKYEHNISFIKCYVDDGCGLWTGTINQLLNFLSDLNYLPDNNIKNPNHKITYVISNSSIDFLDLTLFYNYNSIQYKPYTKPLEKHMLQLHSFHPQHTHTNWIINHIKTLNTHSSTNKIFHQAKQNFLTTLLNSNINENKQHNKIIKQKLTKIFTNNNTPNNKNNNIKNNKAKIYYSITNNPILQQLKLPTLLKTYKDQLPTTISDKFDFTLTYKSPPNLSKLICHKIKTTENNIYIPNNETRELILKFNILKI